MVDYFAPAPTPEERIVRIIKGTFRRYFVQRSMEDEGIESVPSAWRAHSISEYLKAFLSDKHPSACGGENLPDLEEGEVEIARMSLLDSVHGEVVSLRARRLEGVVAYRMVDEYGTEITLPCQQSQTALAARQVIEMFSDCEPSQTGTSCEVKFQSFFYEDIDELASKLRVK
jgi:hypothetical protein